MTDTRTAIRELIAIQLKATAAIDLQMAQALIGKGKKELQAHFLRSAELMVKAAKELES